MGIDNSEVEIQAAQEGAKVLGLSNVSFELMDIGELPDCRIDPFDYILAHGVYSWVDDENRDAILRFCGAQLSKTGLAYISYNAQPGWAIRALVREVLRHHPDIIEAPAIDRADVAKVVAAQLIADLPSSEFSYQSLLAGELERVVEEQKYYIQHEYLSAHNDGFWLREVVERAARFNLSYIADAQFCRPEGQSSPELVESLRERSVSGLQFEETVDLLCNRQFRESIFSLNNAPKADITHSALLETLHAATKFEFPGDALVLDDGVPQEVIGPREREVSLDSSLAKATVVLLSSIWPRGISAEDLLEQIEYLLNTNNLPFPEDARTRLLSELSALYETGQLQLRQDEPLGYLYEIPETDAPALTPLARYEASIRTLLTSPHHQSLSFTPDVFEKISRLDGSTPLRALFEDSFAAEQVLETLVKWGLIVHESR